MKTPPTDHPPLRLIPVRDEAPALQVFAVERDGQKIGEATLVVMASDPTSCSVRWHSSEELMGDVAELIQHYLKDTRGIDGVEYLFD